jgi:uncharacterized membrane protein
LTLEPLLVAPWPVWIHVATVVPAIVLGLWLIFLSRKGGPSHRAVGAVYLALMTVTAIAALFIHATNPRGPLGFSLIHLFVPLTLYGVVRALVAARKHDTHAHRAAMLGVFLGGIVIAGWLAFMPGRIMHRMFLAQ